MDNKGILFDLDGTMWDATERIRQSWNMAIKEFDGFNNREISAEELHSVMGKPMDEIAGILFAGADSQKQAEMLKRCCDVENAYLEKCGGILYPGLEDTLKILSEKYKLCIVSNGQSGYIEAFLKAHKLSGYFCDIQNWGDNPVPKGENIKNVMKRNSISKAVYVGDTQGDADAAKMAGIPFVYAEYGFGNADVYDFRISEFKELNEINFF